MNEKIIARANEIINSKTGGGDDGFCTLTLIDIDDYPTSTTISLSKADSIKWITFCTGYETKKKRILHSNKASVCLNSETYHIGLVGEIEMVEDINIKKEMWYKGLEHHFTDYTDPNFCVLRFTTKRYNLFIDWQSAKGEL